jgi:hypothetical protein
MSFKRVVTFILLIAFGMPSVGAKEAAKVCSAKMVREDTNQGGGT